MISLKYSMRWLGESKSIHNLGNDPYTARNDCCLCLCSAHATQTRCHKHTTPQVICAQVSSTCIKHCQLKRQRGYSFSTFLDTFWKAHFFFSSVCSSYHGAVNDALRANVTVTSSGHLSIPDHSHRETYTLLDYAHYPIAQFYYDKCGLEGIKVI